MKRLNKIQRMREFNENERSELVNAIISKKTDRFSKYALSFFIIFLTVLMVIAKFIPSFESLHFRSKIESGSPLHFFIGISDTISGSKKNYYVKVKIPQKYFLKIKNGTPVSLTLDAYPYSEYGAIHGKIDFVSGITIDTGVFALILINPQSFSDFKKIGEVKPGMECDVLIITKPRSFLDEIFQKMFSTKS